jgi:hypothetical protein
MKPGYIPNREHLVGLFPGLAGDQRTAATWDELGNDRYWRKADISTAANATAAPVHAKAMPVLLLNAADLEKWPTGSMDDALALQRPAPAGALRVVARARKRDGAYCRASRTVDLGSKASPDGTLYRARVERSDGAQFQANGKISKVWETSQSVDRETAIGQAINLIDTHRIK